MQSSRLQEVTLHLSQLVGSYDTHTLTSACRGLAESMHEGKLYDSDENTNFVKLRFGCIKGRKSVD